MDPQMMMMILNAALAAANVGGKDEERGSSYTKGQQSLIDQATGKIKGQGGPPDITQNQNYQQGSDWLNSLFNDPEFFKNFEAPLMRQFNEDIIPGLANRFGGMGSHGNLGSSAFRNQLGREGSNLSTNIAALRGGMQQQGVNQSLQYGQQPVNNYMDYLRTILNPQPNNQYQGATNPFASTLGPMIQGYLQNPNNSGGQSPSSFPSNGLNNQAMQSQNIVNSANSVY